MKYKHSVGFVAPGCHYPSGRTMYSDIEKPTREDIVAAFPELESARLVGVLITLSKLDGSDWDEHETVLQKFG